MREPAYIIAYTVPVPAIRLPPCRAFEVRNHTEYNRRPRDARRAHRIDHNSQRERARIANRNDLPCNRPFHNSRTTVAAHLAQHPAPYQSHWLARGFSPLIQASMLLFEPMGKWGYTPVPPWNAASLLYEAWPHYEHHPIYTGSINFRIGVDLGLISTRCKLRCATFFWHRRSSSMPLCLSIFPFRSIPEPGMEWEGPVPNNLRRLSWRASAEYPSGCTVYPPALL